MPTSVPHDDPSEVTCYSVADEMKKHRESIPQKDRCAACDGCGLLPCDNLPTERICKECGGTGKKATAPK